MKDGEEVEGSEGSVRSIAHRYEGGDGEAEEAEDEMGADKRASEMTRTESGNHWMPKSASMNAARMASASDEEDEGFVPEKPPLRSGSQPLALRNDPSNRLKRSNTFQGAKLTPENQRPNGARSFYQKSRLASSADKATDGGNPRAGGFQRSNTFHNVELRAVEHDKPRRLSRGASFMRAREGIPQPDDASYEVPLRAADRRRTIGDVASDRRSPPGGSPPVASKPADGEKSDCEKCRSSAQKIARLKDVIRVQSMQIAEKRAERTVSARHSTADNAPRKKSWFSSSSSSSSKTAEIELLKQEVEKLRIVNEFLFRELSQNR